MCNLNVGNMKEKDYFCPGTQQNIQLYLQSKLHLLLKLLFSAQLFRVSAHIYSPDVQFLLRTGMMFVLVTLLHHMQHINEDTAIVKFRRLSANKFTFSVKCM